MKLNCNFQESGGDQPMHPPPPPIKKGKEKKKKKERKKKFFGNGNTVAWLKFACKFQFGLIGALKKL